MNRKNEELKFKVVSASILTEEAEDIDLVDIARSRGIQIPSRHLAIFRTVYAKIEEANKNGVRLSRHAVETALPTLIGKQMNLNHWRAGFVMGALIDTSLNDDDEIEVVFTFYKDLFPEELDRAMELLSTGDLSVSFELNYDIDSQEILDDGTRRLHDIDFAGMGLLLDEKPAYPGARVLQMAKRVMTKISDPVNAGLLYASEIKKTCQDIITDNGFDEYEMEIEEGARWTRKYINELPDPSFAVIEPAYKRGETKDKRARHLPFKDANDKVDMQHYRNALARSGQIKPITDSISTEELRRQSQEELNKDKYRKLLKTEQKKTTDENQKGEKEMEKEKLDALKADITKELGEDVVKDWTNEDFQNKTKVDEARKAKADEEEKKEDKEDKEEKEDEKSELDTLKAENEELNARVKELDDKVKTLEATLEAKDSEIEEVRSNAEKIGKLKVELEGNPYTKDFEDEDYLDDAKVENAKVKFENDQLKAENEELKKDDDKEDKDKKEEKDDAEAKDKDKEDASLDTGHEEKDEKKYSTEDVVNAEFAKIRHGKRKK